MEDNGCVEIEEIKNEEGFNSDESMAWDWEDQLYEEWRDRKILSK